MLKIIQIFIILFTLSIAACGGGKSSSGGNNTAASTPPPPPPPPPPPTTMRGEFATKCMSNIQVRRNRTALVLNVCGYDINVGQMNSRFDAPPPITLIRPGQTVAVKLADDSTFIGFGACRAPSIPRPASPGKFSCSDVPVGSKTKQGFIEEAPVLLIN